MVFNTWQPAFPLGEFIECFVHYKGYNPVHTVDRFLPDGDTHLVIDLTEYPKHIYDNETLTEKQTCRDAWFSGFRTKYITIPSGRDSEMFILYFRKGRAYPFTGQSLGAFADHVVDAGQALPAHIYELRARLQETPGTTQKFRLAEQFLLKQFGSRLDASPCVDYAIASMLRQPGTAALRDVTSHMGYSQKHFISLFRKHAGVTPKAFMRVMRFQQAIRHIAQHKDPRWTSVALESGYYDQAHFIHDFREFSGFTPTQYMALQSDYTNYVAVG